MASVLSAALFIVSRLARKQIRSSPATGWILKAGFRTADIATKDTPRHDLGTDAIGRRF
jgi:hypothetical protein